MDQPEPAPQASELLPAERPVTPMFDEAAAVFTPEARRLAEEIIAVGRVSRFSPDTQRALFFGYEESDDGHGRTTIRTRPAGAESPKE
jgi:hypothetical protein